MSDQRPGLTPRFNADAVVRASDAARGHRPWLMWRRLVFVLVAVAWVAWLLVYLP
jgi:hypothetical protein